MTNQNNTAYGLSQPLINVFPAPIKAKRAPTVNDKAEIGTLWIDMVHNNAYTLTSIVNNQAQWSTNTNLGVGVFVSVEATGGDITADVGDIVATLGNITSGGGIVAGNNLTVTTGDLGVLTGDINVGLGNVVVTTGNVRVTAGDIDTVVGDINSAGAVTAGTTITAAGNIVSTTGSITATLGNIQTGAGNIVSAGTISAGTGINTTTGGMTATAGDIVATAGNLVALAGNILAPAGNLTIGGNLSAATGIITAGDINCTGTISAPFFTADDAGAGSGYNISFEGGSYSIRGFLFAHVGNFWNYKNSYFGSNSGNLNDITANKNTACGSFTMPSIADGAVANTAVGTNCMNALTNGIRNCSLGAYSLDTLVGGAYNITIGFQAGTNYTNMESSNICLGHEGVTGESNVMRLGTDGGAPGQQTKCYIAGDVYAARSLNSTDGTFSNKVTVGTANIVSGAGDPNGVVTATKGSLYLNLTGSGAADRAWINTNGGTVWTNLVTAA